MSGKETQQREKGLHGCFGRQHQTSPWGGSPNEATLLLPLKQPESPAPPAAPPGPEEDLLLNGDSGIKLVVKEALQLPLPFRLQVFQEELITGQAAVHPGAHKHSAVSEDEGKHCSKCTTATAWPPP